MSWIGMCIKNEKNIKFYNQVQVDKEIYAVGDTVYIDGEDPQPWVSKI